MFLKNTAGQKVQVGVSALDGSPFSGSVTVYVLGDGGAQAVGSVGSGACTNEGNGAYSYTPSQAETNYEEVTYTFIGTGASPAHRHFEPWNPATVAAAVWGALRADYATVNTFGSGVITQTVNDKSGYSLSAAGIDSILDRPIAEPTGPFTWPGSLRGIIGFQGALARNKTVTSETGVAVRNNADSLNIAQASLSLVNGVLTRGVYT